MVDPVDVRSAVDSTMNSTVYWSVYWPMRSADEFTADFAVFDVVEEELLS